MSKFFPANRPVRASRRLIKSIRAIDLTPYVPIIVTKDFYIIDGQHRFVACQELGLPIYYVVVPDDVTIPLAIQKLQEQQAWRQEEYLHHHAVEKGGCYADLEAFWKFWGLGISNAAVVYPLHAINAVIIREGKTQFEKHPLADDIAKFLTLPEVKSLRYGTTRPFCLAVRKAFETYSPREMAKIKDRLITIPQCANYEQYLTAFANIVKRKNKS